MTKKAQKRLGKSGIRTHDPILTEIYFIKTQISMLFFSKGRGGPWSCCVSIESIDIELIHMLLRALCEI